MMLILITMICEMLNRLC